MGDTREPCVVFFDGGDGNVEQILGIAYATRVPSPSPVERPGGGGETAETSASQNLGFRGRSFERDNNIRFLSGRFSIRRPTCSKLKAAVQRCLERFSSRSCENLQVSDIVPLLFSNDSSVLQEQAARALVQLSGEEAHRSRILKHPQALDGLVRLLFKDDSPNLQIHAALSLANLTLAEDDEEQLWFLRYPNALLGLVSLLFEDASTPPSQQRSREITMQVHEEAAIALGNIASTAEGGAMIMENSHALEGLIRLLLMHDKTGAQEAATRALVYLAVDEENVQKLLEFPISIIGALSGLLLPHSTPSLQENVCKVLAYLSTTLEHAEMIVLSVHFPRALKRLMSLLALHNQSAILPLSNLAITEEIQVAIASYDNVLEAAHMIMSRVGPNDSSQDNVAMFLGNLSLAKANGRKIVEYPGFLPAMVDILYSDSNPNGQEQAAWTLSNLSRAEPENLLTIITIANWPGIVGGLINVLGKDDNPGAQEQAARVLANLSFAPENDPIIARFPDAWTGLVSLLSKSENISMQKEVIRALSNLTGIDGLYVTSECVSSIANLILQCSSPLYRSSTQERPILEQAALALGNLTLNESNRWKVALNEDAIAALLGLLLRFEYPSVQEKAAWALETLSKGEHLMTVATKMPQVVPILTILLSMEQEPWRP